MSLVIPVPPGRFSLSVVPSELLSPGQVIRVDGAVYAHPLDIISIRFDRDPLGRLDAAMLWLLERTLRRLERLERSL